MDAEPEKKPEPADPAGVSAKSLRDREMNTVSAMRACRYAISTQSLNLTLTGGRMAATLRPAAAGTHDADLEIDVLKSDLFADVAEEAHGH